MSVAVVTSTVGVHTLPESDLELSCLSSVDYADHFALSAAATHATPEQWARAMFGDVPDFAELVVWRILLGLRLQREPSPGTVAGWRIYGYGEDWIGLDAESYLLAANLVVQATSDRVALATFIRYQHRLAHLVWPPLSALHRRLVPQVLRRAVNRVPVGPYRTDR
jgi:hypothetical protein